MSLRRRAVYFWAGLAIVAFLLSFGGETFLYTPFYLVVPGFGIFRDQERAAFVFSLAVGLLAGYGFQAQFAGLLSGKSAKRRRSLRRWSSTAPGDKKRICKLLGLG